MDARKKPILTAQREQPRNFVEHLRELARTRGDETWLTVVSSHEGQTREKAVTYGVFETRVRAMAAVLQRLLVPGDRALVMLDNDDHYAVSMLACFFSGVIAVPVFPPESARAQHLERLLGVAADAQPGCILTSAALARAIHESSGAFASMASVAVDEVDAAQAQDWSPYSPGPEDVAFLQYTSGSTSVPKGVIVTHGNLMANERAIQQKMGIVAEDSFVSWSPLYHDMGLIGGLLQPLYSGIPLALCSPQYFLERPARWLEMISRLRATVSGGPDFSYRLCLERVKDGQIAKLDLSSWRVAYTGAEPIRAETEIAFCERFAQAGFDAGAVYACYGLAEGTLLITGGDRGTGLAVREFSPEALAQGFGQTSRNGATLVGCGSPAEGHHVEVVDPVSDAVLPRGVVGEIWASGESIAAGYWNKPRETAETFVEREGRRWLRTGDLGFALDDHLYVTGRIKDLVIVRGHNIYPQDVEHLIEGEVEAVRKGRVAVFSVDAGAGEGIGVVAEISRNMQKLVGANLLVETLSAAVSEVYGEPLSVVVLLNPGALPKTSSGKLQRGACRKGWMDRSLDAYAIFEQGNFVVGGEARAKVEALDEKIAKEIAEIWREVLKLPFGHSINEDSHFFVSGGNSISAMLVASRIAKRWEINFSVRNLFESPRLGDSAAEVRRQRAGGIAPAQLMVPALPAAERQKQRLLSNGQAQQWFLWHLDPSSTAYHVPVAFRFHGPLDEGSLCTAFESLVRRHEALRTVFFTGEDGLPRQVVQGPDEAVKALQIQRIDLRTPAANKAGVGVPSADEAILRVLAQTFDLLQGPLVRMALVRESDDVCIVALVVHHIVSDASSIQILVDELATRYSEYRKGVAPDFTSELIHYIDWAAWHHSYLASGERERQLAYWRKQLGEGDHPVLALPTDYPRRATADQRAAQSVFELPPELVGSLRAAASAHGTTLFTVLLAGFQALLYRYTGEQDIRVGVPVANRQPDNVLGVVGFFVNTLVLRAIVDGRGQLAALVDQVRNAVSGAQAHQDLPFEELVEALQPGRSVSYPPLFQVLFNHVYEDHQGLVGFQDLAVESIPVDNTFVQFEFALDTRERSDGTVSIKLIYSAALFEADTVRRIGDHYVQMLHAIGRYRECAVGDVDIFSSGDRAFLMGLSVNNEPESVAELVHRVIERQAQRSPDAIALVCAKNSLSYRELNTRANRLSHHLIALGVKPEHRVGIALERSMDMVIALLAVMKAGGAYVPLAPDLPADRLTHMLKAGGVELVLTHAVWRSRIPTKETLQVIDLDSLVLPVEPDHVPAVELTKDNLAYLIYTSGSTGHPKGAANSHGALHNRLAWMQEAYGLQADDAVLQKTPFSFDVSVWEFFWPLMNGARLVMAEPDDHRDPLRLASLIQQHAITTVHFVPSMLQAFLDGADLAFCASLRRIVCSGEALPKDVQEEVLRRLPHAGLYNLYGPTETAIDVTHWTCRDDGFTSVPIGKPIRATTAMVLDADMGLVPRGVAGELYLGGVCLARGYLGRSGLTADRFVAHPLAESGERLYRTGDLVSWRADGQLVYLGRLDHQVKIRGLRIELGEIECGLLSQPGVTEAVVIARPGEDGAILVAYVSGPNRQALEAASLKSTLAATLPDYMVPSIIVVLDSLPLSANGKIDRKALPVVEQHKKPRDFSPPSGAVGDTLASIWVEVLGVHPIGVSDNFFDLGGHSLQLVRIQRLIKARLGAELSVVDLFTHPTIGALSQRIERGVETRAAPDHAGDRAQRRRMALLQRAQALEGSN